MNTHELVLDGLEIALKLKNTSLIFPSRSGSVIKKDDERGTIMRVCSEDIESFFKKNTNFNNFRLTDKGNQKIPPIGVEIWVRHSGKGVHVRSVIDSMQTNFFTTVSNKNKPIREVFYTHFFNGNTNYPYWKSDSFPAIKEENFMSKKDYINLEPYHKEILLKLFKTKNKNNELIIEYTLKQIKYIENEIKNI